MTQNRAHHRRACLTLVAAALGTGAPAAAEPVPGQSQREPEAPARCEETCSSSCNCMQGINVTNYKNLVLLNFGSSLSGRIEIEYERALHRRVSVFGAWYVVPFNSVGNQNLVGFGGLAGARIFLIGGAPEGIWFAWQIGGFHRNVRGNRAIKLRGLQTGGMFGWTGVWGRFAFTLGAGANLNFGRLEVMGESVRDTEFGPWLKIGVGVAF